MARVEHLDTWTPKKGGNSLPNAFTDAGAALWAIRSIICSLFRREFDEWRVKEAREAGKMRAEGRDYLVQDGDIMLFRFKV